jgi:hypothetical protein
MKKTAAGRKPAALESQLVFVIDKALLKKYTVPEIRQKALEYFDEHGEEMDGVHMIGRWRNPDDPNPRHANWKTSDDEDQSLEDFFATIHGSMEDALAHVPEGVPANPRADAMKRYHEAVRAIREKHPRYTYARARKAYQSAKLHTAVVASRKKKAKRAKAKK